MPRVGIEDELGVGQALRQAYRVHGRDDQVMAPSSYQDRVHNFSQPRVGCVLALIPAGQGRALRLDPRSREKRIMLACPRLQPIPEGRSCRLTRFGWFKEEPEQPVSG